MEEILLGDFEAERCYFLYLAILGVLLMLNFGVSMPSEAMMSLLRAMAVLTLFHNCYSVVVFEMVPVSILRFGAGDLLTAYANFSTIILYFSGKF